MFYPSSEFASVDPVHYSEGMQFHGSAVTTQQNPDDKTLADAVSTIEEVVSEAGAESAKVGTEDVQDLRSQGDSLRQQLTTVSWNYFFEVTYRYIYGSQLTALNHSTWQMRRARSVPAPDCPACPPLPRHRPAGRATLPSRRLGCRSAEERTWPEAENDPRVGEGAPPRHRRRSRDYGVNSANWTTQLLADYLAANGWSAGMDDILLERPRWLDFVRSKASLDKGPYRCIMFIALVDRDASLAPASGPEHSARSLRFRELLATDLVGPEREIVTSLR